MAIKDADKLTHQREREKFVIDGLNVCFWYKHPHSGRDLVSIRPLLLLLSKIREHGDDFYCIFDHNIKVVKESGMIKWLVKHYPRWFYLTAVDSTADPVILHYADTQQVRIVTNDRYRDFFDKFPWLAQRKSPRLIQGNFNLPHQLTLEKLSYGFMDLDPSLQTSTMLNRLADRLTQDFDLSPTEPDVVTPQSPNTVDIDKRGGHKTNIETGVKASQKGIHTAKKLKEKTIGRKISSNSPSKTAKATAPKAKAQSSRETRKTAKKPIKSYLSKATKSSESKVKSGAPKAIAPKAKAQSSRETKKTAKKLIKSVSRKGTESTKPPAKSLPKTAQKRKRRPKKKGFFERLFS